MAQIESDIMEAMLDDIGRRWLLLWGINIDGDKTTAPLNLTLDQLLPEFIAREFDHWEMKKDARTEELAYMMGVIISAIGKTGTHSRVRLEAALKSHQKSLKPTIAKALRARWFSISREWRMALALALIWALAVIAHSILTYDSYYRYYSYFLDAEGSTLAKRALVPGLFGLAGFYLFRKLTK
jgi:hypothetical protein